MGRVPEGPGTGAPVQFNGDDGKTDSEKTRSQGLPTPYSCVESIQRHLSNIKFQLYTARELAEAEGGRPTGRVLERYWERTRDHVMDFDGLTKECLEQLNRMR
jgi:hypothetical protein